MCRLDVGRGIDGLDVFDRFGVLDSVGVLNRCGVLDSVFDLVVGCLTGQWLLGGRRRRGCIWTRAVRHHHRHRAGRGRQIDVLVRFPERLELGDDVDSNEPRSLERLHEAVATVEQLLDLLAGELTTTRQLAEHPLPIGPRLVDHLSALLFRHRQLGLGIRRSVRTPTRRLDLGFFSHPRCLVAGFVQQLRCALLGLLANLCRALTGGGEHASGLLAQQPGEGLLVQLHRGQIRVGLCRAEFTLEEAFAFLEASELRGDHTKEVPDFSLVETAPTGTECGVGDRRR